MESLFKVLNPIFNDKNRLYWVAYSGGMDSHVLLHAAARLREFTPFKLNAIHINHGLSPNADSWAAHCEAICRMLSIDFFEQKINLVKEKNKSIEALARTARYRQLTTFLQENDYLLTAHHERDQAETVLLQLLRGAGPKGLAAMPDKKPLKKGFHVRPFLKVSHSELEMYAVNNKLHWIEDESNLNCNYTRNFLRQEIFPLLQQRWPSVSKTLTRAAKHCAAVNNLIEESIEKDLNFTFNAHNHTLSISRLLTFPKQQQVQILRLWLQRLNFSLPAEIKMREIQEKFLTARIDKCPLVQFNNFELRRFNDAIYALPMLAAHDVKRNFYWDLKENLVIEGVGILKVLPVVGQGLKNSLKEIAVRFRQGGEFCQLPGRQCHHALKNLFQQWGVPPWLRMRIPLLFVDTRLIAVPGYFLDEKFAAQPDEMGSDISFVVTGHP